MGRWKRRLQVPSCPWCTTLISEVNSNSGLLSKGQPSLNGLTESVFTSTPISLGWVPRFLGEWFFRPKILASRILTSEFNLDIAKLISNMTSSLFNSTFINETIVSRKHKFPNRNQTVYETDQSCFKGKSFTQSLNWSVSSHQQMPGEWWSHTELYAYIGGRCEIWSGKSWTWNIWDKGVWLKKNIFY